MLLERNRYLTNFNPKEVINTSFDGYLFQTLLFGSYARGFLVTDKGELLIPCKAGIPSLTRSSLEFKSEGETWIEGDVLRTADKLPGQSINVTNQIRENKTTEVVVNVSTSKATKRILGDSDETSTVNAIQQSDKYIQYDHWTSDMPISGTNAIDLPNHSNWKGSLLRAVHNAGNKKSKSEYNALDPIPAIDPLTGTIPLVVEAPMKWNSASDTVLDCKLFSRVKNSWRQTTNMRGFIEGDVPEGWDYYTISGSITNTIAEEKEYKDALILWNGRNGASCYFDLFGSVHMGYGNSGESVSFYLAIYECSQSNEEFLTTDATDPLTKKYPTFTFIDRILLASRTEPFEELLFTRDIANKNIKLKLNANTFYAFRLEIEGSARNSSSASVADDERLPIGDYASISEQSKFEANGTYYLKLTPCPPPTSA